MTMQWCYAIPNILGAKAVGAAELIFEALQLIAILGAYDPKLKESGGTLADYVAIGVAVIATCCLLYGLFKAQPNLLLVWLVLSGITWLIMFVGGCIVLLAGIKFWLLWCITMIFCAVKLWFTLVVIGARQEMLGLHGGLFC